MYIYIYLLIEGVLASLLCQDGKFRKLGEYLLFCFLLFLTILVVFRDGIGADYFTYVMHFQNTSDITELTTSDFLLLEPGYVILSAILRYLHAPFEILSFLLLIIIILNFKKVFPYFSSNLSLSFFLYVALFFLSFNFNVIRHGVMAAFVWNACHYWLESKKVSAIFLLVLGALFHILSLTFLLIIPICCSSKRYPIYIYILVLIFSFFIAKYPDVILQIFDRLLVPLVGTDNRLAFYLSGGHEGELNEVTFSIGLFFNIFICFISLFSFTDRKRFFLSNMLFVGIVSFLVFNSFGALSQRLASVCYIANIFLVPALMSKVRISKWRFCFFLFAVLYGILMFWRELTKETGYYIPYQFIF